MSNDERDGEDRQPRPEPSAADKHREPHEAGAERHDESTHPSDRHPPRLGRRERIARWWGALGHGEQIAIVAVGIALMVGAVNIRACQLQSRSTEISERAERRELERHRGKVIFQDVEVLHNRPGFDIPRQIRFIFKNIGEAEARGAHFSMSHMLVDPESTEIPMEVNCDAYGGEEDIAPGKQFSYVVTEPGMPVGGPYQQIVQQEIRDGIYKMRLRARVDYIAFVDEEGHPHLDSATVCRELIWKFMSWLVCEDPTPGPTPTATPQYHPG